MALCSVPYCPEPRSPDWHRCIVCGREPVEHHHVERRSARPSRRKDPSNVVPLCLRHHRKVTENIWSDGCLELPDGLLYRIWDIHNRTVAERWLRRAERPVESPEKSDQGFPPASPTSPISRGSRRVSIGVQPRPTVMPSAADWQASETYDDEVLALLSAQAHVMASGAYLWHCLAVARFRERHRWAGEGWLERGKALFGYSPSKLRDQAALFDRYLRWLEEAAPAQVEAAAHLSDRQFRVLERVPAARFREAMEEAISYVAETGRAEPDGLAGRLQEQGVLPSPAYRYLCPSCGYEGQLKDFRTPAP